MGLLVFVALAFGTLVYAFVTSDFSVALVANNSHTLKPLLYKITGVWGNHEGSMLLWVLVLSVYAAPGVQLLGRGGAQSDLAAHLGIQGLLAAAFLLFISFYLQSVLAAGSRRRSRARASIRLLQDPGPRLSIRPCSTRAMSGCRRPFSYAAAALLVGEQKAGRGRRGPSC